MTSPTEPRALDYPDTAHRRCTSVSQKRFRKGTEIRPSHQRRFSAVAKPHHHSSKPAAPAARRLERNQGFCVLKSLVQGRRFLLVASTRALRFRDMATLVSLWLPWEGCLLPRDPRIDALREHIQRQGAGVEHLVVEGAQVELVAQPRLRPVAQFQYLELADLVGQGLAGPGD